MAKKRKFPTIEDFRVRFPRVLRSHYSTHRTIALILKDKQHTEECSTLLWHCVNDCAQRVDREAGKAFRQRAKAQIEAAILGIPALEFVYSRLDSRPLLAQSIGTLKADLLEKQRLLAALPPSLDYGRHLDWGIVEYAQQKLTQLLNVEVSDAVVSDLLNAAFDVCGWNQNISEDGVRHGLERFRERCFERRRPLMERDMSRRFPTGDKFTRQ